MMVLRLIIVGALVFFFASVKARSMASYSLQGQFRDGSGQGD